MRNVSTNDLQANSDLLFCPFCGGDAHVKEVVSACETLYTVGCSDSECMGYETWLLKPTKDEAISAWNRRAERTCHMIDNGCELCCSECDTRNEYDLEPNYCLNCGAKVITDGDMATDDERREVAERLRKAIGLTEFAEALGFNWTDDRDWGWKDVSNLVADLIEPSCDRDALLALADDMQSELDECEDEHEIVGKLQYRIDRIREALGVDDGD